MNTQHAMLMSLDSGRCASRVVVDSDLRPSAQRPRNLEFRLELTD